MILFFTACFASKVGELENSMADMQKQQAEQNARIEELERQNKEVRAKLAARILNPADGSGPRPEGPPPNGHEGPREGAKHVPPHGNHDRPPPRGKDRPPKPEAKEIQTTRGDLTKALSESSKAKWLPNQDERGIRGYRVSGISKKMTLSKLGLKNGDIVMMVNGIAIDRNRSLDTFKEDWKARDTIEVMIIREQKPIRLLLRVE